VEVHPLQDPDTMQGVLEIIYRTEQLMKEISGLDHFCFQPGGGAHGVYTNASIIIEYHLSRGDYKRDEIITTMFSHPCDAATPIQQASKSSL
jgi:glycine dehydrogenase subunit 2